ncbi:MAG: signal peptidase II [Deltaproteobacteria bacterium]|nr:signal peptidase II [Deltaproteobacteria bacterium]MCL5278042.1 signal peptidase II [Deltaproteobacteria bacterium]
MIPLKERLLYLLAIGVSVVALDQITKHLVVHLLTHRVVVIPGLVDLVTVYNRGMAFGMLNAGQYTFRTVLLTALNGVVFIVLLSVFLLSKDVARLTMISLSLIMGGAAGNIIDRVRLGYVVDFIDAYVKGAHWPAFNVADSAITVGAVLLAIDLLISGRARKGQT